METFYETAMKLKNHKKILSALTLVSTPHEASNLLITNNFALGATSVLLSFLPDTPVELVGYIPFGIFIALIGRKIEKKSAIYTDEYFTALEEYKKYISDLSEIFRSQNINDPVSISYIYSHLFACSLLSCESFQQEKESFVPKKEKYPELLGTKVIDGMGLSRYSSSLLCDLLNSLGHNSCVLCLEPKEKQNEENTVIGIIENNKKFAYDPINADLLYTNKSATAYIVSNSVGTKEPIEYTILTDESYNLNKSRMKNFIKFKTAQPEKDELIIPKRETTSAIASLAVTLEMANFNKQHKEQMQKIKTLSNTLYPNRK